jgi:hypothetical protein
MEADADPDRYTLRPLVARERPLDLESRAQRIGSMGEGGEELIGAGVDLVAMMTIDFLPNDRLHLGEDSRISVTEPMHENR